MILWAELTKAQQHALEAVCEPDPDFAPPVTWRGSSMWDCGVVNGKAAQSLHDLGLIQLRTNPAYSGNRIAEPTASGRGCYEARP